MTLEKRGLHYQEGKFEPGGPLSTLPQGLVFLKTGDHGNQTQQGGSFFFYIPSLVFRRLVLLGTNVIHSTIDWLLVQENLQAGLMCMVPEHLLQHDLFTPWQGLKKLEKNG